jgi:hypothetical protein
MFEIKALILTTLDTFESLNKVNSPIKKCPLAIPKRIKLIID